MDLAAIRQRQRPSGRVDGLLGTGWAHRYRVLHPAYRARGSGWQPVPWAEIAARTGRRFEPAHSSWHEVSGHRLHHPRPEPSWGVEPQVGPVPEVLAPVLTALVPDPASDSTRSGALLFAEWVGYDEEIAGRELTGATLVETVVDTGDGYTVWSATVSELLRLIRGAEGQGGDPADRVLANFTWSPAGDWLVVADPDLASTYVGTHTQVDGWADLEWAEVGPHAPLS